jgi:hypothetical protein
MNRLEVATRILSSLIISKAGHLAAENLKALIPLSIGLAEDLMKQENDGSWKPKP